MARLCVLSYHTSPLAQPGTGDGGGMNVCVREVASALARQGHTVDVFTRRDHPLQPSAQRVEPGLTVHHVTAGPARHLSRHELPQHVEEFGDAVAAFFLRFGTPDAIHAHYWLSGLAGHRLKHTFDVPLIMTFHTLERVKADFFEPESLERAANEEKIFRCADAVLASCDVEADQFIQYYDADPARIHVIPLGVEHAFFSPGNQLAARAALQHDPKALMMLYVGRLQALKGVDVAIATLVELRERGVDATLAIVGGPSGPEGTATVQSLHASVRAAGCTPAVSFVAPQSHQLLSTWMRAADVTIVPSRTESFGLVALESSAAGTPVVASAVGGLLSLVQSGVNGALVPSREPADWADAVLAVTTANSTGALSNGAQELARSYTWSNVGRRIAAVVEQLASRALAHC